MNIFSSKESPPKSWKKVLITVLLFFFASSLLHFWHLSEPRQVVFDEFYFTKFVEHYEKGEYFFDIHPPLGKIVLLLGAKMGGLQNQSFAEGEEWRIGTEYSPEINVFAIRFFPALFGSLLVPILFLIAYFLSGSMRAGIFAGVLGLFENSFLVESRLVLVDAQLFLFTALAILFLVLHQKTENEKHRWWYWIALSLSIGIAISTKWTGVSSLGVAGLIMLYNLFTQKKSDLQKIGIFLGKGILLITGIVLFYIPSFLLHFNLLPKTGTGDAYHTQEFQASLEGNQYEGQYPKMNFWDRFTNLNEEMLVKSAGIRAEHSFSSKWYDWPILQKPVYYWNSGAIEGKEGRIYLVGNPVVWILTLTALFFTVGYLLWCAFLYIKKLFSSEKNIWQKIKNLFYFKTTEEEGGKFLGNIRFLFLVYLANWIPFVLVERPAFLYHYLNAFMASLLIAALFLDKMTTPIASIKEKASQKAKTMLMIEQHFLTASVFFLIIGGFVFVASVTYGIPLTEREFSTINFWDGIRKVQESVFF
jgi:dolichyl-phosphate-mannose-protein mannosyltransferase